MSKKVDNDIPQEAFDWYDDYAHGGMDRRTFMAKLGTLVAVGYYYNLALKKTRSVPWLFQWRTRSIIATTMASPNAGRH